MKGMHSLPRIGRPCNAPQPSAALTAHRREGSWAGVLGKDAADRGLWAAAAGLMRDEHEAERWPFEMGTEEPTEGSQECFWSEPCTVQDSFRLVLPYNRSSMWTRPSEGDGSGRTAQGETHTNTKEADMC
eukprot:EG_transcript_19657